MKVTPKDIDDGEVNRDIVNKSESLKSICENSSKYYQIMTAESYNSNTPVVVVIFHHMTTTI